jgi:hypothetical protein
LTRVPMARPVSTTAVVARAVVAAVRICTDLSSR